MNKDEIVKALEEAECIDGFACPFGMYRQNKDGVWGCFAKYPHGEPNETDQGCIIEQAVKFLKT